MTEPIAMFDACVSKVNTMADGSPRFTFDAGEPAIEALSILAKAQLSGVYLTVIIYDREELEDNLKSTQKGI